MSEELKPCPFCAGTESHLITFSIGAFRFVICAGCKAEGPRFVGEGAEEKAVIAWNTRAPSPWINFAERRPANGTPCFILHEVETPRGIGSSGVIPALCAGDYFKADGDYYYLPDPGKGVLLYQEVGPPAPPTAEQIERAKEAHGSKET